VLLEAPGLISWAMQTFGARFAIACSFQKEGMSILDMAWRIDRQVRVFTLDTGRLPVETQRMMELVRQRYGIEIEVVRPDETEVAEMVAAHGRDLFHDRVELRCLCCSVRKVRPLERKLREVDAWAAGLRREQSTDRAATLKLELRNGVLKINPIADWTSAQLEDYILRYDVPVHPLYARGFASIGCEPCTRALLPGESGRDGRWWWEKETSKECGIHITSAGAVLRGNPSAAIQGASLCTRQPAAVPANSRCETRDSAG